MLTSTDRFYHRVYEALSPDYRRAIDQAYEYATDLLRGETGSVQLGLGTPGDDRAEALVAAITRYVVDGNPSHPAVRAAFKAAEHQEEA